MPHHKLEDLCQELKIDVAIYYEDGKWSVHTMHPAGPSIEGEANPHFEWAVDNLVAKARAAAAAPKAQQPSKPAPRASLSPERIDAAFKIKP